MPYGIKKFPNSCDPRNGCFAAHEWSEYVLPWRWEFLGLVATGGTPPFYTGPAITGPVSVYDPTSSWTHTTAWDSGEYAVEALGYAVFRLRFRIEKRPVSEFPGATYPGFRVYAWLDGIPALGGYLTGVTTTGAPGLLTPGVSFPNQFFFSFENHPLGTVFLVGQFRPRIHDYEGTPMASETVLLPTNTLDQINTALANGSKVFFSPGTYNLAGTVTMPGGTIESHHNAILNFSHAGVGVHITGEVHGTLPRIQRPLDWDDVGSHSWDSTQVGCLIQHSSHSNITLRHIKHYEIGVAVRTPLVTDRVVASNFWLPFFENCCTDVVVRPGNGSGVGFANSNRMWGGRFFRTGSLPRYTNSANIVIDNTNGPSRTNQWIFHQPLIEGGDSFNHRIWFRNADYNIVYSPRLELSAFSAGNEAIYFDTGSIYNTVLLPTRNSLSKIGGPAVNSNTVLTELKWQTIIGDPPADCSL